MATCAELAARLAEAETALHSLAIGGKTVAIQHGDKRLQYAPAEAKALERYIATLRLTMARLRCAGCGSGNRIIGVIPVDANH